MKTSFLACSRTFGRARAVVNLNYIQNRQAVLLLAACRMLSPTGCSAEKPKMARCKPAFGTKQLPASAGCRADADIINTKIAGALREATSPSSDGSLGLY